MKECVSMYLGGDVISADACDYESYKELGLTCPFCHKPVFLRAGSEFVREDGKKVVRDSCFAHFKIDKELGEVCEKRSISKEGVAEIREIERKAKNQRLRLFEKRLLDLVCFKTENPVKDIDSFSKTKGLEFVEAKIKRLSKTRLQVFRNTCKTYIGIDVHGVVFTDPKGRDIVIDRAEDDFYQSRVVNEVLEYLSKHCSERQFFLLMWVPIAFALDYDSSAYIISDLFNDTDKFMRGVVTLFLAVDWKKVLNARRVASDYSASLLSGL